jgi:hypothetical protein
MENRRRDIINHVKKNLQKGYTSESLKWALINQGVSRTEANLILDSAENELKEEAPKKEEKKEKPKIKYELYDVDNRPIKIVTRKPKKWFFSKWFS